MKKLVLAFAVLCAAPTAFACSAMPPEAGFIYGFDKDTDGALSRQEFLAISKADNFETDFKFTRRAFYRLDKNKDGKLSYEELADKVDYIKHPCADWEAYVTKLLEQESLESETIEIYKDDGARQCFDFSIDLETMAKQLDGIHIYHARKDQIGDAFPVVCGGDTGQVNVFTIKKSDLEKAQALGFEIFTR